MSPEQVRGLVDIDGRADIYTLGCLLYEILAGDALHPRGFHGLESAVHGLDARPSQRGHNVPPELDALCVTATAKDRDQRIATARELGESVQRYLDGDRDVALRRQLARDHFERGRSHFERDERALAMREAAAALALDPALEGPAALVGRLMLEPPKETPPEVEQLIVADDQRSMRVVITAGLWVVIAALIFLPLLWWISSGDKTLFVLLAVMLAADGVLGLVVQRAKRPRPEFIIVANTALVVVISRMFSPVLIAPGIAASIALAMVLTPQRSKLGSVWTITVLMIGAVLVPLALEELGVLSPTMFVTPRGLAFETVAFGGTTTPVLIVATVYVVALIVGTALTGSLMRSQQQRMHRRLHMQTWQLRQLVPR